MALGEKLENFVIRKHELGGCHRNSGGRLEMARGRASAGRRRRGRCYAAEFQQDAHDDERKYAAMRACKPRDSRAARLRGAIFAVMVVVAPAAGGLVAGGGRTPPSQAAQVLRLRGGAGGAAWPWRSHAGSSLHHSGAGDQVLGILVPLATVALKKVLGMAPGFS